jgi:ferritin
MANTKSIQKVLEYLKKTQDVVSLSGISKGAKLKYKSVKEILEYLKLTNQVIILTTGRTTLIKFKGEKR